MDKEIEDKFKEVYAKMLVIVNTQTKILTVLDKIVGDE